MSRKKIKFPLLKEVTIIDAGAEGKAIARVDDRVIFVSGVVPEDVVDIQITRKKKSFYEGKAVHFHHYSEKRIQPICTHFGICGGCKWQMLAYKEQLHYKQKQVKDNLERIGKIISPTILPIISSDNTSYYRNKLEYTFSNSRWLTNEEIQDKDAIFQHNALGFHIPGRFDKVLDIDHCFLQAAPSNEIRLALKDYAIANNLAFFDLMQQKGWLRNLIIRTTTTGQVMVIVSFFFENKGKRESLLKHLQELFPSITSLMYVINEKKNDTISDLEVKCFAGNDYIEETMEDITFRIGPKSFFQTNSYQAYQLYKTIKEFADLKGTETVYDCYTGIGSIACFIAKQAKKVVGIEFLEEAVKDAIFNAELNGIENTAFFAGDMLDVLNDTFILENGQADVIITDPPRAGMHEKVVNKLLEIAPAKIIYVSCNPATQARDLALMTDMYDLSKIQPVDMFPHTHHVENIVLLTKKV